MSESQVMGVSWRGWLAFAIIGTYCLACAYQAWVDKSVPDHLVQVASLVVGFYFGQKLQKASE